MAAFVIRAGGTALPAPVEINCSGELIWSANTGRTASGSMVGTVIAGKETFEVTWGVLTAEEVRRIEAAVTVDGGFFNLELNENGATTKIHCYRGPIAKKVLGYIGDGVFYYRSVSVTFVEK